MVLLHAFIYLGIAAAGISGALTGIKKQMDLFGVLSLCVATSIGGGVIRDILIGSLPPSAFIDPSYFVVSLISGLFTWLFYHKIGKLTNILMISDAIGLGVFTAAGSNAALAHDLNGAFIVISMGVITGVGGGVLRDMFAKEIPYVFRKEVYAVASLVGSVVLFLIYHHVPHVLALYICLAVTFTIRVVSVLLKLNFPVFKTERNTIER